MLTIQEFDYKWSLSGTQARYEDIIEKAVSKNIKVIGVSYLSLISNEISPSRSADFINNTKEAKEELFESFNEKNTTFKFGSSTIKVFNWEMFDENGEQYITGVTTDKTREIDANENNNTIALLVVQGDKKAFFSGDMNNLDENLSQGRIGDEDRLKDKIGKVDFLKLGHHGYIYSNTESYLNTLKPEYAVITNDEGGAYKHTIDWLKENKVNYLYTTSDEYSVVATITNDDVYLGYETVGCIKNVNGTLYYIPDDYKYKDYTKDIYNIKYEDKNLEVNSWQELKTAIENNKNEIPKIDDINKVCTLSRLIINIKNNGNWEATSTIEIGVQQNIILNTSENITMLRSTSLKTSSLFLVKGFLSIGTTNMKGKIILDGNKDNVESESTLLTLESGNLDLYKNVKLCNNMNKTEKRTKNASTQFYTSFGSAIYSRYSKINMYGGEIVDNNQDVVYTYTFGKNVASAYEYATRGTGIYMTNDSVLNMYGGKINNNEAQNHSNIKTNEDYTKLSKALDQNVYGVGIDVRNSEINLLGGEISGNTAKNLSITTLVTPSNESEKTSIYSVNNSIFGTAIHANASKTNISNNFVISNNTAELNSQITIGKNTAITSTAGSRICSQVYGTDSELNMDGASIRNGKLESNVQIINNGSIGSAGTGTVYTTNTGGAISLYKNSKFNIKNLAEDNCNANYGGGIYINSSNGKISNSTITNNSGKGHGAGVYVTNSDVTISNSNIANNTIEGYGGGLYMSASAKVKLDDVKIIGNKTTTQSGGGIYAYGNLTISGNDTLISNNIARTYGGGIIVKNQGILNAGEISNNVAEKYAGGGIRVDGQLTMNGGTIKNNTANTTGGGIDYSSGIVYLNGGIVKNNTAKKEGNDIYPVDNRKFGDINKDGKIDIRDVIAVLRHISAKEGTKYYLTEEKQYMADMNQDEKIDIRDVVAIIRSIAANN